MADPRKLLAESWDRLDESKHDELMALAMQLWEETLSATKEKLVKGVVLECRGCHKRNMYDIPIEMPDILTRAKAFAEIANQSHGKVPETKQIEVNAGERTLAALEGLSLGELAAIAGSVEEAEWAELPPAA